MIDTTSANYKAGYQAGLRAGLQRKDKQKPKQKPLSREMEIPEMDEVFEIPSMKGFKP
jgi:hypothetical protein